MKKKKEKAIDWTSQLTNEQLEKIIYNLFCTIIFLMPVIPEKIGYAIYSLKNTMFNVVTIMAVFSLTVINIKKITKLKINIYDILSIIYLILITLSTLTSNYGIRNCVFGTNGRGEGLLTIFSYMATFIICMKGYKYINKTFKVGIIAACIVSIYGIIQANVPLDVKLPFGIANHPGVAEGTMGNQNCLSGYLCIFLPMACYYFLNSKGIKSIIVVALLFAALVFAKTLSGYVVFIAMYIIICLFSLIKHTHKIKKFIKIVIMTLIVVGVFCVITNKKDDSYLKELTATKKEITNLFNGDKSFGTNRLAIWDRVCMVISNNKMTGVGPDSLAIEFKDDQYHIEGSKDILNSVRVDKAHSEYLHIAATTGIPSLVIYLLLIGIVCIKLVKIIFKVDREDVDDNNILYVTMTFIGIISYLAQALGNISVVQVAPIFWTILGIGAGITLNQKVKSE